MLTGRFKPQSAPPSSFYTVFKESQRLKAPGVASPLVLAGTIKTSRPYTRNCQDGFTGEDPHSAHAAGGVSLQKRRQRSDLRRQGKKPQGPGALLFNGGLAGERQNWLADARSHRRGLHPRR